MNVDREKVDPGTFDTFVVCSPQPSTMIIQLADDIQYALQIAGYNTEQKVWPLDLSSNRAVRCIFLIDVERPLFLEASKDDFQALQQAVMQCTSLLWVSLDNPAGSIVPGFARTVRHELPAVSFRTLQISSESLHDLPQLSERIVQLACAVQPDNEVRESKSSLLAPRVVPDESMDGQVHAMSLNFEVIVQRSLSAHKDGLHLTARQPGDLSTLYFTPTSEYEDRELDADEVEIEVHATGVNPREVMAAIGAIPDTVLGFDASGVVAAIGPDVSRLKVGDAVCTLRHGAHSSLIRNREMLTQAMPPGMTFEAACTIPLVLVTAYNALERIARAEKGQAILIHSGAGGVGQTAIQLAQHLGLQMFTTVSSAAKRELVRSRYGIPDENILSSGDASFVDAIKRVTHGRGVDIVLNSLSGELRTHSWYCLAPGGSFVDIAFRDIQENRALDMRPFAQDATFSFFNIARMLKDSPVIVGKLLEASFDLLRARYYPTSCAFDVVLRRLDHGRLSHHASGQAQRQIGTHTGSN